MSFVNFEVWDGKTIFLWHENWHPIVYRVIYDAASKHEAKVVCFEGQCLDLEACQSQLHLVNLKYKDAAKWTITSSGCYSCAATYNEIRVKELEVDWWKFLWFQLAIPRRTFMGWLAIKNKLTIRDRLAKWGYTGDTLYVFCRGCIESKDHLFFVCPFARGIWISC